MKKIFYPTLASGGDNSLPSLHFCIKSTALYLLGHLWIWVSVMLKFLNTDKEIYHSNDVHLFPQLLQTPAGRVWAASRCLRGVSFNR